MKVGILTFPGSPSWGASLQMFATYNALLQKGVEVEIINYISKNVSYRRKKEVKAVSLISEKVANVFLGNPKKPFKKFEKQMKKYPTRFIETTKELTELAERYDRIIVGSDQVWNSFLTGSDMNFYLEFCDDNSKKASYAASFGADNVNEDEREKIAELLSQIKYLSVREERGKEIIKELTGRDASVVIDPTMLFGGDFWRKIKKPSGVKGKYVFFLTIKPSRKMRCAAEKFAKKNGLKLVYLDGGLHGLLNKLNPEKHPVFGIGPAEFLDLIDNAEYVFTNSFHGTAFSVLFNKNFYVEFSSDTNSRLENIVKMFGLEQCVIDGDSLENTSIKVDYSKVNKILDSKRKEAFSYIEGIIK